MTYVESDLRFEFPTSWVVRKYDQQPFYNRMKGMGLKGVDFLLLQPEHPIHLYLLEVKNYRRRQGTDGVYQPQLPPVEELAEQLSLKYEHSRHALNAVYLAYQRKWWFRLLRKRLARSRQLQREVVYLTYTQEALQATSQHSFRVWLELPPSQQSYAEVLKKKLREALPANTPFEIWTSETTTEITVRSCC